MWKKKIVYDESKTELDKALGKLDDVEIRARSVYRELRMLHGMLDALNGQLDDKIWKHLMTEIESAEKSNDEILGIHRVRYLPNITVEGSQSYDIGYNAIREICPDDEITELRRFRNSVSGLKPPCERAMAIIDERIRELENNDNRS